MREQWTPPASPWRAPLQSCERGVKPARSTSKSQQPVPTRRLRRWTPVRPQRSETLAEENAESMDCLTAPKAGAFVTAMVACSYMRYNILTSSETLERGTGIEPATNSLEGCDSTTELLPHRCGSISAC